MTYYFETYGCQMNVSESNGVEHILRKRGWQKAANPEKANLVLINTCSVRITAENRVEGRLGFYSGLKKKSRFKVLVMGCMAERLKAELKARFPVIDYAVGIGERGNLEAIFAELERVSEGKQPEGTEPENAGRSLPEPDAQNANAKVAHMPCSNQAQNITYQSSNEKYLFAETSHQEGTFQSFVPIMNGCNNFCSYCIVPYVRGREVSREVRAVLAEVAALAEKGVKEITLLGQNVNSYRGELDGQPVDFPALLHLVARECDKRDSIKWIRFMSSHPKDMSPALIDTIAVEKRVCKAVHLPVQHGSNRILAEMNRKYTAEQYCALVSAIREKIPDVALTTDILVGFPGETEADLEETLSLMEKISFNSAFMYHYNPREGTRAYDLPGRILEETKIERLSRVIALQQKITAEKMQVRLGKNAEVLLESASRNNAAEIFGHTEFGEMVVVKNAGAEKIGSFVDVKLERIHGRTFIGTLLKTE